MKPALDASRALTVAITAAQADTLKRLDDLATRCSRLITRAEEQYTEAVRVLQVARDEMVEDLRETRELALALAAEVRDGNDDMAKAMAAVFAPKPEPLGPADAETVALAQRLAPVERAA